MNHEDVLRVADEWLRAHAPKDILNTQENGNALVGYIQAYLGGAFTIPNLIFAEQALRAEGKLQLVPPKTAEQTQIDAIREQEERWRKAHQEAITQKPRDFAGESRAHAEAAKIAKDQAEAEKQIALEIERYTCNHARLPGVIDYARTQQLRKDLKKIEVRKNGKRDAVLTLQEVRKIISNLPG